MPGLVRELVRELVQEQLRELVLELVQVGEEERRHHRSQETQ